MGHTPRGTSADAGRAADRRRGRRVERTVGGERGRGTRWRSRRRARGLAGGSTEACPDVSSPSGASLGPAQGTGPGPSGGPETVQGHPERSRSTQIDPPRGLGHRAPRGISTGSRPEPTCESRESWRRGPNGPRHPTPTDRPMSRGRRPEPSRQVFRLRATASDRPSHPDSGAVARKDRSVDRWDRGVFDDQRRDGLGTDPPVTAARPRRSFTAFPRRESRDGRDTIPADLERREHTPAATVARVR